MKSLLLTFYEIATRYYPRWRKVVAPLLRPVPEAAVTVFCTPDDRYDGHPKHVE